jgi:AmiS/UreI family transporter
MCEQVAVTADGRRTDVGRVRPAEQGQQKNRSRTPPGESTPNLLGESPQLLRGREVAIIAIINIFTGSIGVTISILLVVLGGICGVRSNIADAALILLFAFTNLRIATTSP